VNAAAARVFRLSERPSNTPPSADNDLLIRNELIDPSKARVFKRAGYFLAIFWLSAGLALLSLGLVDALLRSALKPAKSLRVDAKAIAIARENMAANGSERGYWQEHEAARETQWQPYVYFRRKPYAGKLIHVDVNGFRVTVNPILSPDQRPVLHQGSVWLFGGSTVWGTGVSDAHTLASELAQLRSQQVLNFGETGYVSAQSQLAFMASLRCIDAARPDVAVFVDGVNDVYSALQSGIAGAPQNESNRQAEFNVTRSAAAFTAAMLERLEGIRLLMQRLNGTNPEPSVEVLATQVALNYLAVIAQTRAIAAAQGVPVLFVWQPSIFDKAQPTDEERGVIGSSLMRHRDLQLATTRALRILLQKEPAADLLVLDQLFDTNEGSIFIDFAHTGSAGNALLAGRLAQELQKLPISANRAIGPNQGCRDRPILPGMDVNNPNG